MILLFMSMLVGELPVPLLSTVNARCGPARSCRPRFGAALPLRD